MSELAAGEGLNQAERAACRMRAIAAELSAAGLEVQLHEGRGGIDITATVRPAGQREIEAVLDEDCYCELRFWTPPEATPAQVSATVTRAVSAITAVWQA